MTATGRAFPAVLRPSRRVAFLVGYFSVAAASLMLALGTDWLRERWGVRVGSRETLALMVAILVSFAVWAARRHRSFLLAVCGPALGSIAAAPTIVAVTEILNQDDELSPVFVILFFGPVISVMIWLPSAIAGVATVRWVRGRWRPFRAGLCSACGYDLAGLAVEKCPECGASAPKRPARDA